MAIYTAYMKPSAFKIPAPAGVHFSTFLLFIFLRFWFSFFYTFNCSVTACVRQGYGYYAHSSEKLC